MRTLKHKLHTLLEYGPLSTPVIHKSPFLSRWPTFSWVTQRPVCIAMLSTGSSVDLQCSKNNAFPPRRVANSTGAILIQTLLGKASRISLQQGAHTRWHDTINRSCLGSCKLSWIPGRHSAWKGQNHIRFSPDTHFPKLPILKTYLPRGAIHIQRRQGVCL